MYCVELSKFAGANPEKYTLNPSAKGAVKNDHLSLLYVVNHDHPDSVKLSELTPYLKGSIGIHLKHLPRVHKEILNYTESLRKALNSKNNGLSLLETFDGVCLYIGDGEQAYIYFNTIPNVHKLLPHKITYYGVSYNFAEIPNPIVLPGCEIYKAPIYTIMETPTILQAERSKLIKGLKPFEMTELYSIFKGYKHRMVFSDSLGFCLFDIALFALNPQNNLKLYTAEGFSAVIDVVNDRCVWAMSNNLYDRENLDFLNRAGIYTGDCKLLTEPEIVEGKGYLFQNDTKESLNLSGKKNKSAREAYNRISKLVGKELRVIETDDRLIMMSHFSKIRSLVEHWAEEAYGKGNEIGYELMVTPYLSYLNKEVIDSIPFYLLLVLDRRGNLLGYLYSVKCSDSYVYQAENMTLNGETYKGLRRYTIIKEAQYWAEKSQDPITIDVGNSWDTNLSKYKASCNPVRIWEMIS